MGSLMALNASLVFASVGLPSMEGCCICNMLPLKRNSRWNDELELE
jgi:hypothetical protein